ncbi:MAG: DNA recombination protein RmuC, partial [Acidothermus sp.]|nr:DNA recombination protein RmuC [Acidothermus sp.]
YGALRQQVEAMSQTSELLRAETQHLVQALRSPQTRGAWGEYQLRQVIEFAGMVEHCHFHEQASVRGEEGRLRPDVTVDLPGGKHVIIDAKVPLAGYLDAIAATDPASRDEQLRRHARHLREHVEQLGSKNYWATLPNTPEFVVLYVPAEAFLSAALDVEPDLIQRALEKNVVIATPTTLILMLLTVAFTWRQEALAANAQKVLELGRELHGRLATMGGHISRLGSQLGSAVESFNKTVASLEGRVLVTARRLAELQVVSEELDQVRQIDVVPRQVQAPELVASASDALVSLADHPDVPTPSTPRGDTAFPELDTASGDP